MTNDPSMWQRSTTRSFLKWLFTWRTMRRMLVGVAGLVTLYALFCTEETIRGKHAWDKYRRQLEARGEHLDFKAFIPKPVPDGQNFAATPVIKSWFPKLTVDFWQDDYARVEGKMSTGDFRHKLRKLDLDAWARAFNQTNLTHTVPRGPTDLQSRAKAAPRVLEALRADEPIFAELHSAIRRPYSRYPVNYNMEDPFTILLPHLSGVRNVCRRLQLKACAELAAGQSTEALDDVKLIFSIGDSLREDPFLVSYLVQVACIQITIEPVWEGLAVHRWSDAQVQELQAMFQQCNFVADVKRPFEAERAAGIQAVDVIRRHGVGYLGNIMGSGAASFLNSRAGNLLNLFVPSGWYYLEQYNLCHAYQTLLDGTIDPSQRRVFPDRAEANEHEYERNISGNPFAVVFTHHRVMAAMLLPALNRVVVKAAVAQTLAEQVALACALERYRLANGQFPDKLDALVPAFIAKLPADVTTGEPYKYQRTADGQFVLYSVGWNEEDDGGVPGKTDYDDKEGDWVWEYPSAQ
ncbi:MAG TPA: hypothetical protein VL171_15460 [Verrucomicrobiae bacterium]|nr:hypothetical protein [Verrucomicrobiae bacterium]